MKLRISGKGIIKAAIKEGAPEIFCGVIAQWVDGKDTKQFYEFLDSGSFWDKVPVQNQRWLLSYRPWDLKWLTLDWAMGAIGKANMKLGFLVGSSRELQTKLDAGIKELKEILAQ